MVTFSPTELSLHNKYSMTHDKYSARAASNTRRRLAKHSLQFHTPPERNVYKFTFIYRCYRWRHTYVTHARETLGINSARAYRKSLLPFLTDFNKGLL